MMHDAAEKCQWPTLAMYRGFDVFLFLCSLFFFPRLVVREDLFYILQKSHQRNTCYNNLQKYLQHS